MENFKFMSYIPTPTDQYMLGIAKIKVSLFNPNTKQPLGDLELRYKHVKTKDGTGSFFTAANYTTTDSLGEKKYIPCFLFDSRSADDEIQDFLRDKVNQTIALRSIHTTNPQAIVHQQPTSMKEVAAEEQLPF
jgi:hypothetical protein